MSAPLRAVLVGLCLGLALAGCGRRGALEPPPGAAKAAPDTVNRTDPSLEPAPKPIVPSVSPVGTGKKGQPITAPKSDFILDPIL
nr:lipoprotein [Alsobacter ponti]